jgi:DNA-binding TFAR19-related protein (PDSD5 family)
MADLNEQLRQGATESDGLAAEAGQATFVVDRLIRLASQLSASVEGASAEAHRRLDLLEGRLAAAEGELAQENGAAVGALQGILSSATHVHGQASKLLDRVRGDLGQLRAEKDGVRSNLEHEDEATRDRVQRYDVQVRALEQNAESHREESHAVVDVLRQQVEAVRATVAERRQALLGELHGLEYGIRQRLDDVVQAYEEVAQAVEHQLAELHSTTRSLSEQVTEGLSRRLQGDALSALEAAAGPLREAIDDLEDLVKDGKKETGDSLGDIAGRIGDVTAGLERLRQPLDSVKQYLR